MEFYVLLALKRPYPFFLVRSSLFSNTNLVALFRYSNYSYLLQPVAIRMAAQSRIQTDYDDSEEIMGKKTQQQT